MRFNGSPTRRAGACQERSISHAFGGACRLSFHGSFVENRICTVGVRGLFRKLFFEEVLDFLQEAPRPGHRFLAFLLTGVLVLAFVALLESEEDQTNARRVDGGGQAAIRRLGEVGVGESDPAVHRRHVFEQLADVAELASSTGDHDATDEFALESAVLDFIMDVFDDL